MEFSELIHTGWTQAEFPRGPETLPLRGSLCVTVYHLLLSPGPASSLDLWLLLLRSVDFFEKQVASDSGTITLRCKDLRVLQLEIEGAEATLDIAPSIEPVGVQTWPRGPLRLGASLPELSPVRRFCYAPASP
ncbi:myotubularin-related protein 9-like [Rhinopithecus roxellana]|uniref:myotubularin-related protein 9-like n=1 Tax=Rhinopithecus roxellana TaxID=61622 RepID=UPI0012374D48|nr:myotubularin-related protein 9-like [Rhinopithecus roxellana]XP_030769117.1 myotubularin-related protein 9-like [Rhinopithecus roxellana]XP_030769118.1 myotubularin-related protein 9-like [Rhinopithecus roxellana]XP_030769119.1 myotubularin-related protein 9-like [Rhinopithecus roxellana]XP_030769120.1 myotubularin-related protein 9-like [Rhinopithecus roxellana]